MRISELSRESGVSIPTIKFYLREGVVPAGHRTAPNQAAYDASHLRRLRLIRVLLEVGGLSLGDVKRVLSALADERMSRRGVLGVAHRALESKPAPGEDPGDVRREIDEWIASRGWHVGEEAPARSALTSILMALRGLGWRVGPEVFDRYADHIDAMTRDELAYVARAGSREEALESTVIGTVVFERAIAALRRLAQEHHARQQLD